MPDEIHHRPPYAEPKAAARLLLDIVRGSIVESDLPYAYTGATNSMFTRAGGSVAEYSAGIAHARRNECADMRVKTLKLGITM
jgi:hypothetical protein